MRVITSASSSEGPSRPSGGVLRSRTVDRSSIVAAALELFAESGYRSTTMTDIGAALGIRGPSLYRHVPSKQYLLAEIMLDTMHTLISDQRAALSSGGDDATRLRRVVEAHVRYHAQHRPQAFVGNREIGSLERDNLRKVLVLRDTYERGLRSVIEQGCASGAFTVAFPRLTSYAILDMGMGVSSWYRRDGEHSVDEVAYTYAEHALRMLCLDARPTL